MKHALSDSQQVSTNRIDLGDSLSKYAQWAAPTTIVSDGAYGVRGFVGDTRSAAELPQWYEPHVKAWSKAATTDTSLWFWNTEVGWASCHPLLLANGWEYVELITWDKGIAHIAGNVNSNTIRRFPVVTEVSALYVRKAQVRAKEGMEGLTLQDWLRAEWQRTGLPFRLANEACGVANAATRKWLTPDHMWYLPSFEMLEKLRSYANEHGAAAGAPYFSMGDSEAISESKWTKLRSVWNHQHGLTNVWSHAALRNDERMKGADGKFIHTNQKPLELMRRQILATTNEGDVVWEPFGGLCSASVAAKQLKRDSYAAEMNAGFQKLAIQRIANISTVI